MVLTHLLHVLLAADAEHARAKAALQHRNLNVDDVRGRVEDVDH
jgi:hypothetical protein